MSRRKSGRFGLLFCDLEKIYGLHLGGAPFSIATCC